MHTNKGVNFSQTTQHKEQQCDLALQRFSFQLFMIRKGFQTANINVNRGHPAHLVAHKMIRSFGVCGEKRTPSMMSRWMKSRPCISAATSAMRSAAQSDSSIAASVCSATMLPR